jgi:Reverse transcriptase (RNA-dependent DNA polymerase)
MAVKFQNFEYSYKKNGKWIFVPTELGRQIGNDLKAQLEKNVNFEDHFYHLRKGGHIEALHKHRTNLYFARLDIRKFFYGITRNRVARILKEVGVERHLHYAKWSTVRNPYAESGYVLPYGFVQSPISATLVLKQSPLGKAIKELNENHTVSVFVDDITISANSEVATLKAFEFLREKMLESGFSENEEKAIGPSTEVTIFNCNLENSFTEVTATRVAAFDELEKSITSKMAFQAYCDKVSDGNSKTQGTEN